jgi:hypothetical protein
VATCDGTCAADAHDHEPPPDREGDLLEFELVRVLTLDASSVMQALAGVHFDAAKFAELVVDGRMNKELLLQVGAEQDELEAKKQQMRQDTFAAVYQGWTSEGVLVEEATGAIGRFLRVLKEGACANDVTVI